MSMTAEGPTSLEKAIEILKQRLDDNQSRGSEEEVIIIIAPR